MKYVILLGDGMADWPVDALGGKTPLEAAKKPNMDKIAQLGAVGLVHTIPEGMPPGSDTANLSVMGYDPKKYYSGRSPLEAVSMGVDLKQDDVAYRCNIVTLSEEGEYEDKTMLDYAAGEISTAEAQELIKALQTVFNTESSQLYPGISYRHCMVLNHAATGAELTPPHDITGQPIKGKLPKGQNGQLLESLMKQSWDILANHPVNLARKAKGLRPANSAWFWGEGTRPRLDTLAELYGLQGGVVCAVDLIRGLGICAGMRTIEVPGATGGMVTNYEGKARAALSLLQDGCDLVYIHVEAPDECGHQGKPEAKVDAIEHIDGMLGLIMSELDAAGDDYAILLTPDHPTPIRVRTHVSDPVPFVLYSSKGSAGPHAPAYTEANAKATGLYLAEGPMLMKKLVSGTF